MPDIYEQQQFSQAPGQIQGAKVDISAGERVLRDADGLIKTAKSIYSNSLKTEAVKMLNDAYNKNDGNPAALEESIKKIKSQLGSNIMDHEVAVDFMTDFDIKSNGLMSRALRDEINLRRKEDKETLANNFNSNLQSMSGAIMGILQDDEESLVDYQHSLATARGNLNKKDPKNKLNIFSEGARRRGDSDMSSISLNAIKVFLTDPDADPILRQKVIDNFGEYSKKMYFNQKDLATAQKMVEAAKKNGGGSKKDLDSLTYIAYDNELSKWNTDSKNKDMSKASMTDIFAIRVKLTDDFDKGALNKAEYHDLMKKTGVPFLKKIESYGDGDYWIFSSEKPYYTGFSIIKNKLEELDASPDQRLYAYESFIREYSAEGGTDERSDANRAKAKQIANNTVNLMLEKKFPNWNPQQAKALVTGRSVYLTPDLSKKFRIPMNAKMVEIEVDD